MVYDHVAGTTYFSNWWLTYPPEKYESQLGWVIPSMKWKIKNVPNHQPVRDYQHDLPTT